MNRPPNLSTETFSKLEQLASDTADSLAQVLPKKQQPWRYLKVFSQLLSEALRNVLKQEIKPSVEKTNYIDEIKIINTVCAYYNITLEEIQSTSRKKQYVLPRQIAHYLLKQYTPLTQTDIWKYFGQDRTTVIHSLETIENYIQYNKEILSNIEKIKETLFSSQETENNNE